MFQNPLPLTQLALIALEDTEGDEAEKQSIAEAASTVIQSKSSMLKDYFSMYIDSSGNLESVPLLLGNKLTCYIIQVMTKCSR